MDGTGGFTAPSVTTNQEVTLPQQLIPFQYGLQAPPTPQDQYSLDILDNIDISQLLASPTFPQEIALEAMATDQSQPLVTSHPHGHEAQSDQTMPLTTDLEPMDMDQDSGHRFVQDPSPSVAYNPQTIPCNSQPQQQALPGGDVGHADAMEDSSFEGMEPSLRVDSTDLNKILFRDPFLGQERLGSVEMAPSKEGCQRSEAEAQASWENVSRIAPPAAQRSTGLAKSRDSTKSSSSSSQSGYMSGYQLPEFHVFRILVNFMSSCVLEETVTDPQGCLLCYRQRIQPEVTHIAPYGDLKIVAVTTIVKETEKDVHVQREFKWLTEKQKKYTELLLRSFERGLILRSENGNLYATRRAATKLFWSNTQESGGPAKELKRDSETEIFNWKKFHDDLGTAYCAGNAAKFDLPAVWISFAQKWDTSSCAVKTKLVWARIEPTRATEMVKAVNPNVRELSTIESLNSSLLYFSK